MSPSASPSPTLAPPSDNFDLQLFDEHHADALQGLGIDCDRSATTSVPIVYASTSVHPCVDEHSTLTLHVGQQFAAAGEFTVTLYAARGV